MKPPELNKTVVAIAALVCFSVVACFGIWVLGRPSAGHDERLSPAADSKAALVISPWEPSKSDGNGALGAIAIVDALRVAVAVADGDRILSQNQQMSARIFVNESLKAALIRYRFDLGDYPSTEDGIKALLTVPEGKADKWRGPYMLMRAGESPRDPWGQDYHYRSPGIRNTDSYDLFSSGPDTKPGTPDDIGNW